jgi:hypothetical protein
MRVAGVVTHRQRPECAPGVIFVSLEVESKISERIVWPGVRPAYCDSCLRRAADGDVPLSDRFGRSIVRTRQVGLPTLAMAISDRSVPVSPVRSAK